MPNILKIINIISQYLAIISYKCEMIEQICGNINPHLVLYNT